MDGGRLPLGLDWDRDFLVAIADEIRPVTGILSVVVVNPFVMYVLARHTQMSSDCRAAYLVHHVVLMSFDFFNCFLYRMYVFAPLPYFMCTGLLCTERVSPRLLFTFLSFWTISLCVPYLFIMMRMHQRMLNATSPLKVGLRFQITLLSFFTFTLILNVFGFAFWTTEHEDKERILKEPMISWARNVSSNFLVLGEHPGETSDFSKELLLLAASIGINFSYYIFITWHAGWKIGKHLDKLSAKTMEAQLRFIKAQTTQAYLSAVMFISPMLVLFLTLTVDFTVINGRILALLRFGALMLFSHCSFGHAYVFLSKNPWFRRTFLAARTKSNSSLRQSTVIVSPPSNQQIAA